jgi:hypothetical protein
MKILHYIFLITSISKVELYFIKNQNKPICANCKFFIPNKNECSKFGNVNIITGHFTYEPASTVRNDKDKCGENGICFKKNYFKFITIPYYSLSYVFYPILWYFAGIIFLIYLSHL